MFHLPNPQHFQFDCDLVPIEAAYLKHKEYDHYAARVGLRIHLPSQIENILRAQVLKHVMKCMKWLMWLLNISGALV